MSFTMQARETLPQAAAETAHAERPRAAGTPRFLAGRGLAVSQPGDAGERQAERLAARVMEGGGCSGCTPEAPCASCAPGIRRSAAGAAPAAAALPELGAGAPLDAATRDFFEPRFGRDLGDVRVHAGERDGELARGLAASAFTVGRDIVFAPGRYQPGSVAGRELLAHELAHVAVDGTGDRIARSPDAGVPDAGVTAAGVTDAGAAGAVSDAGVAPSAGVPPAPPGPLFDSLYGACPTEEEGRRRDAFALRHFHLDRNIPSTTFGMFDADYFPMAGIMPVTVKVKFKFVSANNAPGFFEWVARTAAGEDLSRFYWTDAEQQDFKQQFIGRVSARWSAQHTMVSTKPCWDFRAVPFVTPVEVADDSDAHYVATVHKSPGPGIDYQSGVNDPDVAHPERAATADLWQSDVREESDFNSSQVATAERQRLESALAASGASPVLFGNDDDTIDAAQQGQLTAFADAAKRKNPSDPSIPLQVDGFASLDGDATHNQDLSDRRAVAVRTHLAREGVPQPIGVLGHGPVGVAGDALSRRADISVDHTFETTYTSNRYSVGEHEFGHMLGLPDEYLNATTGVLGTQQTLYSGLVTSAGVQGPAVWGADTASQMSNGIDVLPRHYVTLWEALGRMTDPHIRQGEWSIT